MTSNESKIVNYLIRMVVPLRREFGENLDVQNFLHDAAYAQQVLNTASTSQYPILRDHAEYVRALKFGPRVGNTVPPKAPPMAGGPGKVTAEPPTTATTDVERKQRPRPRANADESPTPESMQTPSLPLSEEDEMRERIMKKYTSGLR